MARVTTPPGNPSAWPTPTRPSRYRIPICQIGGMVTYREVDLRAGGDDPLMQWIQGAADWEITDLRWDEKMDQPGEVTWRGGTLWDATTDGEVHLECSVMRTQSGEYMNIYVRAPFRPKFTGSVTVGGVEWRAFTVRERELADRLPPAAALQVADAVTTGMANLALGAALAEVEVDAPGPYRTASVPIPVTAQTMLSANCTGMVEQAFKDSIEATIRRVFGLLMKLNQNRGAS